MYFTPDQLVDLRSRAARGEMLDPDTARKVVEQIRAGRVTAMATKSASKKSRSKKAPMSDTDLFGSIDAILAKTAGAKANADLSSASPLHTAADDQLGTDDDAGTDDDGEVEEGGDAVS